jgi:hypothetical protein
VRLFFTCFLLGFFFFSTPALASLCSLDKKKVSKDLVVLAKEIELASNAVDRGRSAESAPRMSVALTRKMLLQSWRAFGYRGAKLRFRLRANLRQIALDSDYRPHLSGYYAGEASVSPYTDSEGNLYGGARAGLFAFLPEVYREWKDYGSWKGQDSRLNPLSNIFAAVALQVRSKKVFRGKGRINTVLKNKC